MNQRQAYKTRQKSLAGSESTCTGTPTEKGAALSAALAPPSTPRNSVSVLLLPGDGVAHRYSMNLHVYSAFTLRSAHKRSLYTPCIYSILPYMGNNTYANLNFDVCTIVTARCTLLAPLRGAYELLVLHIIYITYVWPDTVLYTPEMAKQANLRGHYF